MVAIVLGPLQKHLQRLVAVRVALAVARVGERVGLVDEEDAADRGVDQLVGLHGGLAEVLAHQVGALGLDEMVAAEQSEGVEDPAQDAGHGGLAGAGGAREHEVPLRRLDRQALPGPQPRHVQLRGQRLHLALDRFETDHVLQLGERLFEQCRIGGPGRQMRRSHRHDGLLADPVGLGRQRARRRQLGLRELEVTALAAEQRVDTVRAVQHVLPDAGQGDRREVGRVVVPVALGDRREPGRGVHEGRVDAVHRPVQGQRRGGAARALVRPRQPVPQLLALRLLAATAHQRGRQQRLGLPEHLQSYPCHAAEETRLDAQHRIVDQRIRVPDQLLPVLDEIRPAGVQEPHLRIRVHGRQTRQRPVQLRDMTSVEPVRGVREQQIARRLKDRLHPPAQPVPGVERAAMAAALFPEALPVPEHPQQRGRRVDAQRVQPEPAVGHPRIHPDRGAELLLRLRIGPHRVGIHTSQPGEVGRGLGALRAEVHHVPHKPCPR